MAKRLLVIVIPLVWALTSGAQATIIQTGEQFIDVAAGEPTELQDEIPIYNNTLQNAGFETGEISPWSTDTWTVIDSEYHDGAYGAESFQNHWIRQDFPPVPVEKIRSVTMWAKQPYGPGFQAVDFVYETGDHDEFVVNPRHDWTFLSMGSHLRPSGNLIAVRVWGYSGVWPELTHVDDVSLDIIEGTPTRDTTWGRIKSLY